MKHLTRREHLALFADRRFRCHRCGRHGPQLRHTDPSEAPPRFRIIPDTLLLPYCRDCEPVTAPERDQATDDTTRAALYGHLVDVDTVALDPLLCSVPGCGLHWYDLGTPPPFVAFYDADVMLYRHPCPWCVADSPTWTGVAHARAATEISDPDRRLAATVESWLATADRSDPGPAA